MKIRCIKAETDNFTTNKIYEVINNRVKNDFNFNESTEFNNIDSFNSNMRSKFELVQQKQSNKQESTTIKLIDKDIVALRNAQFKHLEKIDRIGKQIKILKEKKEKHIVIESKKQMTVAQICDALGFDVEIVKGDK